MFGNIAKTFDELFWRHGVDFAHGHLCRHFSNGSA
jgi:hypothetical protein